VLAVVDRGQIGEVTLDACRELVGLVVADDAEARLPSRALSAAPRVGPEPLSEPRPLRGRDEHDGGREQGDVQPAHAASLAQA
jgi:hypothetical protein